MFIVKKAENEDTMEDIIRVLLVDDEEGFTSALSKRLERRGFVVSVAAGAAAGFAHLENTSCDVVVLDVKMPGVNGMQALKTFKSHFHGVEVILLTGHADITDAMDSMRSGAYDFLLKPTPFEVLQGRIRDAAAVGRAV